MSASIPATPGPWFLGRVLGHGEPCIVGDGDSVICTFAGRAFPEGDANLIAAAPDLLATLEAIASLSMSQFYKPQDLGNAAIKLAAAAIAKAEGRE